MKGRFAFLRQPDGLVLARGSWIFDRCCVGIALCCLAAEWRVAEPGWRYEFPRDHRIHPEFKTEWWYFTGNVADQAGRRFGYQLTFFRQGIRPPGERDANASRFIVGDLKFAHFTITDVAGGKFHCEQKTSRGAFGEAGFGDEQLAWIEDWSVYAEGGERFRLRAQTSTGAIDFQLESRKPPVVHGVAGVSAKAEGAGHASHYYSMTRLATTGALRVGDRTWQVTGDSWFDHEWATNQLAPGQTGWDWLSVHFDDGVELMLYRMRLKDGAVDPTSSGTLVQHDGTSTYLSSAAYTMTPVEFWKSARSAATYPVAWHVSVPEQQLELTVRPLLRDQELALPAITYWEGAVEIRGTRAGEPIRGRGYLELTGYVRLPAFSR